jgi:4-hydroxythreonine-4-phosphate dehydrogenase
MKPKILLLMGDTAGVGPELCAKVLADLPDNVSQAQIIVTGDLAVLQEAAEVTSTTIDGPVVSTFAEVDAYSQAPIVIWNVPGAGPIPRRQVSREAGAEVLANLMNAISLARDGLIQGFVFAPFNKQSMHLAGSSHYSELELFKEQFDRADIPGEFNVLDGLWVARVTSHIPVAEISATLNEERVYHTMELLGESQEQAGIAPVLAVAALNPHAGENGIFGSEENTVITPAIERLRKNKLTWKIEGPIPADTLFPQIRKIGGFTGVIGMYHDQLQIATKIIGLERGVTFHPGMKVPIATAAHGTAFDIQGTGTVNHQALKNAMTVVLDMV